MRIGFLTDASLTALDWAKQNGFGSIAWVAFPDSFAAPGKERWREDSERFAAEAKARDIRISAIGALYKNPLDPKQTEFAGRVFQRAVEVAALIGVRTVSGFAGAVIEVTQNERGGNPVYQPSEASLPRLLEFWEPLARYAAERGVRIAFEHCPQGQFHLPVMHYNFLGQVAMWERFFNATKCENLGIEWDASHLMCQFVDPVANIHQFGAKVFHVHAKDAFINRTLLEAYGICHPGVAEHRWPGFGQANWAEIIHALLRAGYDSDLNLEGWHDPVLRDHADAPPPSDLALATGSRQAGRKLEQSGQLLAKKWLEQFVPRMKD